MVPNKMADISSIQKLININKSKLKISVINTNLSSLKKKRFTSLTFLKQKVYL